jgi:uncharacterized membrane protein YhhN
MTAAKSPWIIAFAVVAVVHLVLNGADASPWDSITKCFLAPLLAAWVVEQKGPPALVIALFLELGDSVFVVGMAAFAGAHITFIRFFVARGAVAQLRRKPLILIVYTAAAVGMVAYVWTGLDVGLRPVIPIYAALLVGTAATSLATDLRAGVGGALFLVSDGIIALGQADRVDNDATATGLAIMAFYIVSIYLLSTGILSRERATVAAGFDRTQRTDCWPVFPD